MKWTVGSFADEQWLQFGLWGIGASFPEKVQLVSPTLYLFQYLRNNADVKSNARFVEWRQNLIFDIARKLFHITPMHFQPQNFRKGDKSKSCGNARKLTNIMYIIKTPTTPNFVTAWLTVYLSQPDTHSVIHPSRCWFPCKSFPYRSGVGAKKALRSNLKCKNS